MNAPNKLPAIRNSLQKMEREFRNALPAHITPEKFIRTIQTAVAMNPDLGSACSTDEGNQSFLAACTKAAQDGLVLDGREAALVTFNKNIAKKNEPKNWVKHIQYIPMVAGLLKKARNSGQIKSLTVEIIYKKDTFIRRLGDEAAIIHEPPALGEDRGEPIGAYAIAFLSDGTVQREVMDRNQIMNIAKQSKNSYQYDPDKGDNWGEWWRKTLVRRISKYLPSSSDRDDFLTATRRIDDDFDFAEGDVSQTRPAKKRGGGAAALEAIESDADKGSIEDAEFEDVTADQEEPDYDRETGEIINESLEDDVI